MSASAGRKRRSGCATPTAISALRTFSLFVATRESRWSRGTQLTSCCQRSVALCVASGRYDSGGATGVTALDRSLLDRFGVERGQLRGDGGPAETLRTFLRRGAEGTAQLVVGEEQIDFVGERLRAAPRDQVTALAVAHRANQTAHP